jgi:hypothetical protein
MEVEELIYDEAFCCETVIMKGRMWRKIEGLDGHREFHDDLLYDRRTGVLEPMLNKVQVKMTENREQYRPELWLSMVIK